MPLVGADSCIELHRAMVGFDTVNTAFSGRPHAERPLAEWLEATAKSMGLATRRLAVGDGDFNLLVTHEFDAEAPWLLFESHLDVVSVAGMTIDPFAARREGNRIYGRGACDTKASGAAMLWALRRMKIGQAVPASATSSGRQAQPALPKGNNIAILFSLDEESGKRGISSFVKNDLPRLDFKLAGAIVGEPTLLRPVIAHNGVARICVTARGVACHSSNPAHGRSAIRDMVKVIDAIESRYIATLDARHPLTGKAQCSINVIHGGVQTNMIPAECRIYIDRRFVPGEDVNGVVPAMQRVLDDLRRSDPAMSLEIGDTFLDPTLDPSRGGEFSAWVGGVLTPLGIDCTPCGAPYATDASNLSDAGVPAVVLGPGSIEQAHTKDEWVDVDQLERAVDVYGALMAHRIEPR